MDSENKRQGKTWLLVGSLATLGSYLVTDRQDLFVLVLLFLGVTSIAVSYLADSGFAQGTVGFILLIASTVVMINMDFPAKGATPVWFGLLTGSANYLSAKRLSLLTLLSQLAPIVALTVTAVTRHQLDLPSAMISFSIATASCILGHLLARRRQEPIPQR